jgi:hypothetical protein
MWSNNIDGPFDVPNDTGLDPGYHLNIVKGTEPESVLPYVVTPDPKTLWRVWAGDDPANPAWTVPLKFADEAEAKTVLADFWTDPVDDQ